MSILVFLLIVSATVREAYGRDTNNEDASHLWLRSVSSYCANFQSDPDITRYFQKYKEHEPLRTRDIRGYTRFKSEADGKHKKEPNVFPVKVHTQREGEQVWIVFEIAHSEPAIVSRFDPFEFQKTVLEKPDDSCSKIVSKARFMIERPKAKEPAFQMSSTENSPYKITAYFDATKIYHSDGSQDIVFPFMSDPGDVIFVDTNDDLHVDFQNFSSLITPVSVRLVLWDWTLNATLQSSARFDYQFSPTFVDVIYDTDSNDPNRLFTVELMNTPRLRITLKMPHGDRSGKLYVNFLVKQKGRRRIVKDIGLERMIEIKLPDRPRVFPDDLIYLNPKELFQCDEDGDKYWNLRNKHCTVRCQASGLGISALYVTRLGPMERRMKSASFVLKDSAVAILDVGPASGEIEGEYQCTVVDVHGRIQTQDLTLYTSFFTKIQFFGMYDKFSYGTIKLTCTAYADKDLNISISVLKNEEKTKTTLDNYEQFMTREDNKITKTVSVKVPQDTLPGVKIATCRAHGKGGDDSQIIRHPLKSLHVKIVSRLKWTKFNDNDTYAVTCNATGLRPFEFRWMMVNYKLIAIPALHIVTETHGEFVTSTAYFQTVTPREDLHTECTVRNEYSKMIV